MNLKRMSRATTTGLFCATTLVVAACGGTSSTTGPSTAPGSASSTVTASAPSPTPVRDLTVLLDWFPNPDHISLYVAQKKGYFTAAGLNVTLQAPSDPTDPPKLVSTGKVELGISYEPEMFFSNLNGLKVKAVAALIPTALNSLLAVSKSPVKTPSDLAGQTVGNSGQATDSAFLQAIYAKYHIDGKSVKNVTVKTSLVEAMIAGSVSATIGGYRNIEAVQLQSQGYNPVVVPVTDAGVPNYDELVIIANSDRLASDSAYQQLVKDFLGALAKGAQDAQADRTAAEEAMKGVTKGYKAEELTKMIDATAPLLANTHGFGYMDSAGWDAFGAYLKSSGLISKQVAGAEVMTDDLLPVT